jgi:hypothetical protein
MTGSLLDAAGRKGDPTRAPAPTERVAYEPVTAIGRAAKEQLGPKLNARN